MSVWPVASQTRTPLASVIMRAQAVPRCAPVLPHQSHCRYDKHAMATPQHDLDPAGRHDRQFDDADGSVAVTCSGIVTRPLDALSSATTAAANLVAAATSPRRPLSGQPPPVKQLARRQAIPPRRRRHRRAIALRHDPPLLCQRPTPPRSGRNHLNPRHRRHRRMLSHTPMSSPTRRG
jgi:hypothetical protein